MGTPPPAISLDEVISLAKGAMGPGTDTYRTEFLKMLEQAKSVSS